MASSINASTSGAGGVITTADNTGILNIQTAGTTAVTVDASQNVGIGTTSPKTNSGYTTLTLNNASSGGVVEFTSNNTTVAQLYNTGTDFYTYSASGKNIVFDASGLASIKMNTNGTERMRIDTSGYITNAVSGMGNGLVQGSQYYRLNSGYAGANNTSAQSMFGVGVTLAGNTQYEFEILFIIARTAGTSAHNISAGFAGTATLNNILYVANGNNNSTLNVENTGGRFGAYNTASSSVIVPGSTSSTGSGQIFIKGTVSINAGGTFIPQYTLSAAPGGAYTTQIGSYIKISPIGASGANISIGSWA